MKNIRCDLTLEVDPSVIDACTEDDVSPLANTLRDIADDLENSGATAGYVNQNSYDFEIPGITSSIDLGRDKNLAVALILMSFDLPMEAGAAARQMIKAARAFEGATTKDLMLGSTSYDKIRMARNLLNGLLEEV